MGRHISNMTGVAPAIGSLNMWSFEKSADEIASMADGCGREYRQAVRWKQFPAILKENVKVERPASCKLVNGKANLITCGISKYPLI